MGAFPMLGLDRCSWTTENEQDLVALTYREATDPLSQWLTNTVVPSFHHVVGERLKVRIEIPNAISLL